MKKLTFVRVFSLLLALVVLCGVFASCGADGENPISSSDEGDSFGEDYDDSAKPSDEEEQNKNSIRYGLIDPQYIRVAKMEYNEQNQLLSVTALSTTTLAPMYYETHKMDRIYSYGEDGLLSSIWVSFGIFFELSYEESGEGETVGTASFLMGDGAELSVRVTLNEEKVLLREEYFDGDSTVFVEYDAEGNLLQETRNGDWHLKREESEETVRFSVWMGDEQGAVYEVLYNEDGTLRSIASGATVLEYFYDGNGYCVRSAMANATSLMSYNSNGQINMSESYRNDSQQMESFEYDELGKMIKYVRHYKDNNHNQKDFFTYTYGEDGVVQSILCEYVEYDQDNIEIRRRTETIQ